MENFKGPLAMDIKKLRTLAKIAADNLEHIGGFTFTQLQRIEEVECLILAIVDEADILEKDPNQWNNGNAEA